MFQPKFHMEKLDEDTVALLSRRAYDVAASTRGVKVFLNGKRIAIKVKPGKAKFSTLWSNHLCNATTCSISISD
jgi:hypothetical protein